jgi:hypothetical protein
MPDERFEKICSEINKALVEIDTIINILILINVLTSDKDFAKKMLIHEAEQIINGRG